MKQQRPLFTTGLSWRSKVAGRLTAFLLAAMALLLGGAGVNAQAACQTVHGFIDAHEQIPPTCESASGQCGEGAYSGVIQGSYVNGDTSFITTLDSATTSVYGYTADTTAQVSVAGRQGTLLLKNAGFINVLTRQLAELESIVGGTGELAGASGLLFVTGTFDANNNGRFAYAGQVCLP
jgi:hypothetical protein